jgi:hypothetical protein
MQEQPHNPQPGDNPAQPEQPTSREEQRYKTLAVRVDENLHTQLRFIAQLSDTSITEEIRRAIEHRIATAQDDPALIARAQQAQQEVEREAAARSAAIAGFIGKPATDAAVEQPTASSSKSRRSTTKSST